MRTFWLVGKETSDTESLPESTTAPAQSCNKTPFNSDNNPLFADYLNEKCDGFINRLEQPSMNESCLSLFHSYQRNESKRTNGYRSAPIISFREFYSPADCIL